jgi:uncharacterized damage-inducible protein DinB
VPTIDLLLTFLEYSEAMNRKVWESIKTLTDQQFLERSGYSHGSIRDTMVHLAVVEQRWLRGLKEEPNARSYTVEIANFPTPKSAFEFWDETSWALLEYARGLNDTDLMATPVGMYGPRWQVLLHLVNHATDHRSQVLRALTDFGAPTFDQDFILYQWFNKGSARLT